jgi:hypothetical protein
MAKLTERKKLDRDCLSLWSNCVIALNPTCRNCNSDYRLSGHHIRVKQHQNTRYFIDNGLTLCWKCHSLQHYQPERFHDMIIEIIGQGRYDFMKELSAGIKQYSLEDLREQKEFLKQELTRLKGE